MDASHPGNMLAGELAGLGRAPRRLASWTLALIVTTLALSGWPGGLLDVAIVYLVASPLLWYRVARRAHAGVALAELFVTPAVLIATALDAALVVGAVQSLLLARAAMQGGEHWPRAAVALLAGIGCGVLIALPVHALSGYSALTPVPIWHLALVAVWCGVFGCGVAMLSYCQGGRSAVARRQAAAKSRVLAVLVMRLGRYLAPQVRASLFAEVMRETDVSATAELALAAAPRRMPRRRWLTVFFSDIVGFTSLTEALEPEEVAALLNAYLDAMTTIALAHGGTLDKFIGDGIMVFFGDPDSRGRAADALACVQMALAMQARIRELAATAAALGVVAPLRVRMGVASGVCTVGDFGAEMRLDYTALGNAVNLASRLETAAAPGAIMASACTAALVAESVNLRTLGALRLPGVAQPVDAFLVGACLAEPLAAAPAPRDERAAAGYGGGVRVEPALASANNAGRD